MARYRKLDPRFWSDAKVRQLCDLGKLGFLFILTHPNMTALGAMRATIPGLAAELGWPAERFRRAVEPARRMGMLEVNEQAAFIGCPRFINYNEPEGPNTVVGAWLSALELIPECPERSALVARCSKYLETRKWGKLLPSAVRNSFPLSDPSAIGSADLLGDGSGEPSPIPEPQQQPEPEQEPEKVTELRPVPGTAVPGMPRRAGRKAHSGSANGSKPGTAGVAGELAGVRAVLVEYGRLFEKKTGSRPAINWGRDGAIAKELIELTGGGDHGAQTVLAVLHRYFESDDPWIRTKSGYTFPAFKGQWNRLAAERARPASSRVEHINAVGEESKRLLREVVQ